MGKKLPSQKKTNNIPRFKIRSKYAHLSEQELIEQAKKNAQKNLRMAWRASQTVFKAIYDIIETDIPFDSIALLTGFAAGIGTTGISCSALLGGFAALSLVYGTKESAIEAKKQAFRTIIESHKKKEKISAEKIMIRDVSMKTNKYITIYDKLVDRFIKEFETIHCKELLKPWHNDLLSKERSKKCENIVTETAKITMELLLASQKKEINFKTKSPFLNKDEK